LNLRIFQPLQRLEAALIQRMGFKRASLRFDDTSQYCNSVCALARLNQFFLAVKAQRALPGFRRALRIGAAGFCVDPVEKKALYHILAGDAGAHVPDERVQPRVPVLP